ncbi:hypothetical protein J6590_038661 [Homalodisca vitripennis]|nr:hypothetical protein J6590_038661 [Homalodisca vitripennis]
MVLLGQRPKRQGGSVLARLERKFSSPLFPGMSGPELGLEYWPRSPSALPSSENVPSTASTIDSLGEPQLNSERILQTILGH